MEPICWQRRSNALWRADVTQKLPVAK